MNDLTDANWHTSSHSGGGNNCVEVATNLLPTHGHVYVRDTKDREGSLQQYTESEWTAFLTGVRHGEFDI
jgi:Domain of unknown function (DUF397)